MIEAKANLEATQNEGWTALMYAAQNGHDLCARELLKAGAVVDARQPDGETSLTLSCRGGHEICTRLLLEVTPKGKIAEHLKKCVVPRRVANIFQIIMFATSPHTFL